MMTFVPSQSLPAALSSGDVDLLAKVLSKHLRLKKKQVVGLRFVSLREMEALNQRYRGKRRPTDVLSFESSTKLQVARGETGKELGDIVVCPSYAKKEAARRGLSWREELIRLMVHGVLHLVGYDHATQKDEARMFVLQERCVWVMMQKNI